MGGGDFHGAGNIMWDTGGGGRCCKHKFHGVGLIFSTGEIKHVSRSNQEAVFPLVL